MSAVASWVAHHKATVIVAIAFLWIGIVTTLIAREDAPGAATEGDLQAQVQSSLTRYDARELESLFVPDTVGSSYATDYLSKLSDIKPTTVLVSVDKASKPGTLLVSARTASGATTCTMWEVARKDGRWLLDGTPPLYAKFASS